MQETIQNNDMSARDRVELFYIRNKRTISPRESHILDKYTEEQLEIIADCLHRLCIERIQDLLYGE